MPECDYGPVDQNPAEHYGKVNIPHGESERIAWGTLLEMQGSQ